MSIRIQWRRGTAAKWASANPTLANGEAGFENDTGKFKIGDGATAWSDLEYTGSAADVAAAQAAAQSASDSADAALGSESAAALSASAADGAAQARVQELRDDLADPTGGAGLVAFRQEGVGTVTRTILSKERERVSVLDFIPVAQHSAIFAGTSTYDAAQAILRASVAAGDFGTVELPGRLYCVGASGVLIQNRKGQLWTGRATIRQVGLSALIAYTGSPFSILFDGCENCTVSGLTFDGNGYAATSIGSKGGICFVVDSCEFFGSAASRQLASFGGTRTRFSNNYVHSPTGVATRGIYVGNLSASELEYDASVYGNKVSGNSATGIVMTSVGGECFGNTSENNGGSGIIFPGGNGMAAQRISCFGNTCRGNTQHGIQSDIVYTTDADLSKYISVSGNTCVENNGSGIYAVNAMAWSITGNTCRDNNIDGSGTGAGIQVEERAYQISVSGNNCTDSRASGSRTQTYGIICRAQAHSPREVSISGNVCSNNAGTGIVVTATGSMSVTDCSVTGNIACGNEGTGVFCDEGTPGNVVRLIVSANVCNGNSTTDLRATVVDVTLQGNRFTNQNTAEYRNVASGDTSFAVGGRDSFRFNNSAATAVNSIIGGQPGQVINLFSTNANTTINRVAGHIELHGAVNALLPSNGFITLRRVGGIWFELSRSF